MIRINVNECYLCGTCVGTCPVGVLSIKSNGWEIDHEGCIECERCIEVCPVGALFNGED